jgi:hypothetical protein
MKQKSPEPEIGKIYSRQEMQEMGLEYDSGIRAGENNVYHRGRMKQTEIFLFTPVDGSDKLRFVKKL